MKTKTLHRLFTAVLTGTLLFGGTQLVFANELEDIQNAGVIKVGVEGTYQPYTYHDEDGNLTGFDVDVAKAIAEKLGVEVDFTEGSNVEFLRIFWGGKDEIHNIKNIGIVIKDNESHG